MAYDLGLKPTDAAAENARATDFTTPGCTPIPMFVMASASRRLGRCPASQGR
jgi:hypothetical protein